MLLVLVPKFMPFSFVIALMLSKVSFDNVVVSRGNAPPFLLSWICWDQILNLLSHLNQVIQTCRCSRECVITFMVSAHNLHLLLVNVFGRKNAWRIMSGLSISKSVSSFYWILKLLPLVYPHFCQSLGKFDTRWRVLIVVVELFGRMFGINFFPWHTFLGLVMLWKLLEHLNFCLVDLRRHYFRLAMTS